MIHGIINVYKEQGYTSADVVARLRGILRQKKIGHTGTLDPMAEGVLPVCLGHATKLVERLTDKTKEYVCTMELGRVTDTDDVTGRTLYVYRDGAMVAAGEEQPCEDAAPAGQGSGQPCEDAAPAGQDGGQPCEDAAPAGHDDGQSGTGAAPVGLDEALIREACMRYVGTYGQIPPMYAAIKQQGKKLYELARAGVTVERSPREVTISELEVLSVHDPYVEFRAVVSKGTYLRALCRDIGEALNCGATMAALKRTRSGAYGVDDAWTLPSIEQAVRSMGGAAPGTADLAARGMLTTLEDFFSELPALHVRPEDRKRIDNGNPLYPDAFTETVVMDPAQDAGADAGCIRLHDGDEARVYDDAGRFCAVYAYDAARGKLYADTVFPDGRFDAGRDAERSRTRRRAGATP